MSTQAAAIPGTVVPASAQVAPGGAQGVSGGANVSTDAGNIATIGSDNLILVPQSQLWSMRLRSFNAVGNPNFEVDQKLCGTSFAFGAATRAIDRWSGWKVGTMVVNGQQMSENVLVPGTNFCITQKFFRATLATQQATLGGNDVVQIGATYEGIQLRELISDVHSFQLLVRSSVAGLKFGIAFRDSPSAYALTKLATIPTANTWTLLQFPNLPIWTASGSFPVTPGALGMYLNIQLAAGATVTAPANDVWGPSYLGALGQDNFASKPVNSTFDCAFCQHEPGQCTTLMDKPFSQNYDECLRYYQKTYDYGTPVGTASVNGAVLMLNIVTTTSMNMGHRFKKPMAKVPTMTAYATSNGAVNSANNRQNSAVVSVSSFQAGSAESPCYYLNTGGTLTLNDATSLHYTADTGW